MQTDNTVNDVIICDCNSSEHQIVIQYENNNNFEEVYISYSLDNRGLWFRLKNAFQYVIGKKSKYGHFGELVLPPTEDTINKLEKIINKLKSVKRKNDHVKNKI